MKEKLSVFSHLPQYGNDFKEIHRTLFLGQKQDLKLDVHVQLLLHISIFTVFSFSVTPAVLWEAQRVW